MVLVHAHCAYKRILHSHNTGIVSQYKSAYQFARATLSLEMYALCARSREVTSDSYSVLGTALAEVVTTTLYLILNHKCKKKL